ncbi:MAG: esterase family protein, partial [Calditrichaeota bacterium]
HRLYAQTGHLKFEREKNLLVVRHVSEILGGEKLFRIFVPENRRGEFTFPVLYVLHGVLCHSEAWPDQTQIEDLAEQYEMILVFPDGGNSWYIDSPLKPDMQYESYIIKELIPLIERSFPAKSGKYARAIMGASMGGHGAMTLTAKYPEMFCSASSFFGILKLTDEIDIKSNLVGPFLTELLGPYKKNKKLWQANSAYELAGKLKNSGVHIFLDCGSHDVTPAMQNNLDYHDRLVELGIPHTWSLRYGGHTSDFINENLKEHLDFHWQNFKQASGK